MPSSWRERLQRPASQMPVARLRCERIANATLPPQCTPARVPGKSLSHSAQQLFEYTPPHGSASRAKARSFVLGRRPVVDGSRAAIDAPKMKVCFLPPAPRIAAIPVSARLRRRRSSGCSGWRSESGQGIFAQWVEIGGKRTCDFLTDSQSDPKRNSAQRPQSRGATFTSMRTTPCFRRHAPTPGTQSGVHLFGKDLQEIPRAQALSQNRRLGDHGVECSQEGIRVLSAKH
jgi:hypothetical protein